MRPSHFILRRLLLALPTLLGICVVTFAMIHLAPGDPLDAVDRGGAPLPKRALEAQRRLYFLDLPLFYNPRPEGLAARERRILGDLRAAGDRGDRGRRAAIACGTLCVPALHAALRGSQVAARERIRAVLDELRRAHPGLGRGAPPDSWASAVAPLLRPERLAERAARAGGDAAAWRRIGDHGTAALPAAMAVLLAGEGRARRHASEVVSELAGIHGRLGEGRDGRVLSEWREWWFQRRRDFVRYSSWQRIEGRISETQFAKWLARIVTFEFGASIHDGRPVGEKLAEALPVTLLLSLVSLGLAYLIAVPLGVYAAVRRGTLAERAIAVLTFLLYSMPSFWVAMMLILLFGGVGLLDWFPIYGLHSAGLEQAGGWTWLADRAHHLVLPVTCLTYGSVAVISRYQRGAMLEVMRQDYIRTARAKGLGERTVILKHGLRNGLLPTITLFGLHFPYLISGSVIIERIFNIPGMGLLTFDSFLNRDYPVIMAVAVLSAGLTLVGLILADLLYGVVDPRIARGAGRTAR